MDTKFHKITILEKVFDKSSSIYPLIISVPNPSFMNIQEELGIDVPVYIGIHFLTTDVLLSVIEEKPTIIEIYFDKNGNTMKDPFNNEKDIGFIFISGEIYTWCEGVIYGKMLGLEIVDQPYIYRDQQFESFEYIVREFPMYKELRRGNYNAKMIKPSRELAKKLDNELLRLRSMLI